MQAAISSISHLGQGDLWGCLAKIWRLLLSWDGAGAPRTQGTLYLTRTLLKPLLRERKVRVPSSLLAQDEAAKALNALITTL